MCTCHALYTSKLRHRYRDRANSRVFSVGTLCALFGYHPIFEYNSSAIWISSLPPPFLIFSTLLLSVSILTRWIPINLNSLSHTRGNLSRSRRIVKLRALHCTHRLPDYGSMTDVGSPPITLCSCPPTIYARAQMRLHQQHRCRRLRRERTHLQTMAAPVMPVGHLQVRTRTIPTKVRIVFATQIRHSIDRTRHRRTARGSCRCPGATRLRA